MGVVSGLAKAFGSAGISGLKTEGTQSVTDSTSVTDKSSPVTEASPSSSSAKGSKNPKVAEAAKNGTSIHSKILKADKANGLAQDIEVRVTGNDGKKYRVDKTYSDGGAGELKPNSPTGVKKGVSQGANYIEQVGYKYVDVETYNKASKEKDGGRIRVELDSGGKVKTTVISEPSPSNPATEPIFKKVAENRFQRR